MDYLQLISWIGVAGLVVAIAMFVFGKSKDSLSKAKWFLIPGILTLLFVPAIGGFFVGIIPALNNEFGGAGTLAVGDGTTGTTPVTGGATSSKLCPFDGLTVKLSAQDRDTGGATGGTHAYRLNGGSLSTVSDKGTFTASCGDTVEVLYGNESNTFGFFANVKSFVLGYDKKTPELLGEFYANGSVTTELLTSGGTWTSGQTTNYTGVGANDQVTTQLRVKGQTDKGLDTGFIYIIEYNKTHFDKLELRNKADTSAYSTTSVPTTYTSPSAGRIAVAYDVNDVIIAGSDYQEAFKLFIDKTADGGTSVLPDACINITLMPKAPYINDDLGGIFSAPSVLDEDNRRNYLYTPVTNLCITA